MAADAIGDRDLQRHMSAAAIRESPKKRAASASQCADLRFIDHNNSKTD
jgi:hypothetical protein